MMVDMYPERDSLEDGGEIIRYRLEDEFHTLGTKTGIFDAAAITRTYKMVYKLRVASKCPCDCSCTKFHVPCCAPLQKKNQWYTIEYHSASTIFQQD